MGPSSRKTNETASDGKIEVVVGLGGNVGKVEQNLAEVVRRLAEGFDVSLVSRLYRTRAIGPAQADFLNAALLLQSHLPLDQLLRELQKIELQLGRVRLEKWGPRTVDLDILWSSRKIISSSSLTVPHMELRNRIFALLPLLDVYPAAKDPRDGRAYRDILAELPASGACVVADSSWWEALPMV